MKTLDSKGRCCGKKPLMYKRDKQYFCARCDRAYSMLTLKQIPNFAYDIDGKRRNHEPLARALQASGLI